MFNLRSAPALIVSLLINPVAIANQSAQMPVVAVSTAQQKINTLSVPFVPNVGQWDRRAAFKANTMGGALFVTMDGAMVYSFPGKPVAADIAADASKLRVRPLPADRGPGWALTETLVDAQGTARLISPAGLGPNEIKVSHFTGDKTAGSSNPVNTYNRVQLGEVYPGVNLQLRATGNNIEKIFTVAPGRNPHQIQVRLDGTERLEVSADGQLVAHTGNGPISFTAPIAFQEDATGNRESVMVAYALQNDGERYGFTLGAFDPTRPLIIDPLLQSTYLGGGGSDQGSAVIVHPVSGDVIVAGTTSSINLPSASGGGQNTNGGGSDGFVSRFNANLTTLLQTTYIGGSGSDGIAAISTHPASGDVIVAGYTNSTNLPGTSGGAQATGGSGGYDGFISRFNATLTTLLQSTYVGGSGEDQIFAVTVHPMSGEVIVAGYTKSTNFPGTAGGAQVARSGGFDGFVSRFNATLTTRLQSTYLGGTGDDAIIAVTVHPTSGEVIVAGFTASPGLSGSTGGAQATLGGSQNGFVSRLNPNLTALLQSTYVGGGASEQINAITVHPASGEVIVAGYTTSSDLPGILGGAQTTYGGGFRDGFVSRLNATLTTLLQSTYVGGSRYEWIGAVIVHPVSGEVVVAGNTDSIDLPRTAGGVRTSNGGGTDGFVSRFNASLTTLLQSTYLGGSSYDSIDALVAHPVSGELIVVGSTSSTNLPGVFGGAQSAYVGVQDGFVTRLTPNLTALCNLDINGDSSVTSEKDGVLLLRYLLGFRGAALIAGVPLGPARADAGAVEALIGSSTQYDVFGQPSAPARAAQDGLALTRLMLGVGDSALLTGIALPTGATFTTGSTVRANVNVRCGSAY